MNTLNPDQNNGYYRNDSARAKWWNYGGGIYHVIIKTKYNTHYFGQIIHNSNTHQNNMIFSKMGNYANEIISKISEHQYYAHVPVWSVMPDHIHLMVIIDGSVLNDNMSPNKTLSNSFFPVIPVNNSDLSKDNESCSDVSQNVRSSSYSVTPAHCTSNAQQTSEYMSSISPKKGSLALVIRQFKQSVTIFAKKHNIPFAWQPRFYDIIITKQYEFDRTWQYIENNVAKWKTKL
ncbi:MAG: hypothetical protein IIY06_02370 [Proteobacteria bacterium]|nr:hypothetical protein [Pseudomonadota bacterium]